MSEQQNQDLTTQEKQALVLPKNIRQMGQPGGKHNVYIEDYVYTYLHMFLKEKYKKDSLRAAVLLGTVKQQEEKVYAFISKAAACDFSWIHEGNDEKIRQLADEHFQDADILGWYVCCSGQDSHIHSEVKHYYAQMNLNVPRYFIYEDELENEFEIYGWEQNALHRMSGYYIYYEKNTQMQEFLIREKSETQQQKEVFDPETWQESRYPMSAALQEEVQKKRKPQKMIYAACVAVLIVVAATGVTQIGNYQNLKSFQETMSRYVSPQSKSASQIEISAENEKEPAVNAEDQPAAEEKQTEAGDDQSATGEEPAAVGEEQPETAEEQSQPEDDQGTAGTGQTAVSGTEEPSYYIVQKGDSLMSISRKIYQSTSMVDQIRAINNIDNMDVIYEGQKLLLP